MQFKPLFPNQHGALIMAFIPYLYAILETNCTLWNLFLGISWFFIYCFSYPFLELFKQKKSPTKYLEWAKIYAVLAILFAIPLLIHHIELLQFLLFTSPLFYIQIYFTRKNNERNIINTIAAILIFGLVGVANGYISTMQYHWHILINPSLFFIATTLYIKSVARERKNPYYRQAALFCHLLLGLIYFISGDSSIAIAYFIGLLRVVFIPYFKFNLKQIGILEFIVMAVFVLCLAY